MSIASEAHAMDRSARTVFGALFGLLIGCTSPTQPGVGSEAPGTNSPPSTPSTPPAPPVFPGLAKPGTIYVEAGAIYAYSAPFHNSLISSRYVFYEDDSFELQFISGRFGFFKYTGRIRREDTRITFEWDGWSTAGPWGAVGTLRGDTMRVEYNLIMQHSDFVDGVYARAASTP